jgi:Flp pilus assembly protein TadD
MSCDYLQQGTLSGNGGLEVTSAVPFPRLFLVLGLIVLSSCMPVFDGPLSGASSNSSFLDRGMQLLASQDYRAAKAEIVKSRPFQTGDTRALLALAIASDMTGDFRMSDRAYNKLLERHTDRATLFNNMGYSYMLRGDFDKSSEYLAEAARLQPDNQTVKNNLQMLRKVTVR